MVQQFIDFKTFGTRETARALRKLGGRKTLPVVLQTQAMKRAAKRVTKAVRSNIKDAPDHWVYRGGEKVIFIKRGQLRRSIGTYVGKKVQPGVTKVYVGPRVKYGFKSEEKAGWFGHMVEYGHKSVFGFVPPAPFVRKGNVSGAAKIAGTQVAKDFKYVIERRAKKLGLKVF